jgi:transcriptional regulator with XRE-family HTH domain
LSAGTAAGRANPRAGSERLAEEAGLHPRYLSDIERGRRNVSLLNLVRLARGLGIELAVLSPMSRPEL